MEQPVKPTTHSVKVLKEKNGIPTIIEYNGNKYMLQHKNQYKRS